MDAEARRNLEREFADAARKQGVSDTKIFQLLESPKVNQASPAESPFRRHSRRVPIINIPASPLRVRFLGPPLPVWLHFEKTGQVARSGRGWLQEKSVSVICLGFGCERCKNQVQRKLYGYAPVLCAQVVGDCRSELLPGVLGLWKELCVELEDVGAQRGSLVEFDRKGKIVTLIEPAASYQLPASFDVRDTLMSRWHLSEWPDQGFSEEEEYRHREQA